MEHLIRVVLEKHAAKKKTFLQKLWTKVPGVKWHRKQIKTPEYKTNRALGLAALGAAPVAYGLHEISNLPGNTPPAPRRLSEEATPRL